MARSPQQIVKLSTPGDLVFALSQMLGFWPAESLVAVCINGERQRLGFTMRYDLAWLEDVTVIDGDLLPRIRHEGPGQVFFAIFSEAAHPPGALPHVDLADHLGCVLGDLVMDIVLAGADRWWSYTCTNPRCCPPEGNPLDAGSRGATQIAAAYALNGKALLPSRDALARSVAYAGDAAHEERMIALIEAAIDRNLTIVRKQRQDAVLELLSRLVAASRDPRTVISDADAAEFAALFEDVLVRDEVLVRAGKVRRHRSLIAVLTAVARLVPPPYDAPVCATLAYITYASGNGVLANVLLDRVFATDPDYSLAKLIGDALWRQVPPELLVKSMRMSARDLAAARRAG
jgi:hypothetical protein